MAIPKKILKEKFKFKPLKNDTGVLYKSTRFGKVFIRKNLLWTNSEGMIANIDYLSLIEFTSVLEKVKKKLSKNNKINKLDNYD